MRLLASPSATRIAPLDGIGGIAWPRRASASRTLWLLGLLVVGIVAWPPVATMMQSPGDAIRTALVAAAVDLPRPPAFAATAADRQAIEQHFAGQDAVVDTTLWPQIKVTLRGLDHATCLDAALAAHRIGGLVVISLDGYRSPAQCGEANAMSWWITP
jgi:hypothetical protein